MSALYTISEALLFSALSARYNLYHRHLGYLPAVDIFNISLVKDSYIVAYNISLQIKTKPIKLIFY